MTYKIIAARFGFIIISATSVGLLASCSPTLLLNQTAERTGGITATFVNETPYRASFSLGTWDALDRSPPGPLDFAQNRLEGNTIAQASLSCARNFAVGTQVLCDRASEHVDPADLDADAFDTVVHFSDQPVDSDLAAIATVGTALGVEKLLGVDYTCGDELLFTFVEDPDAPGGFRIDFSVVPGEPE